MSTPADFLDWLRPGGPWVLTAIDPDRDGGIETRTVLSAEEIDAFVAQWNGKWNIYYTANRTKGGPMNSKPSKADIESVEFVLADLDPAGDETPEEARQRYMDQLTGSSIQPSAVIVSGGGLNCLWRLEEPIATTFTTGPKGATVLTGDAARVETISKAIMKKLGSAAGTQNIDRILRLPGTTNLPNEAKRARGRVTCESSLLYNIGVKYGLASFPTTDESAGTAKQKTKSTGKKKAKPSEASQTGALDWAEVDRILAGPDVLPDGIGAKGLLILGWDASLKELNHELLSKGLLAIPYGSWSEVAFGLAASLKSDGLSREAVAALLLRDRPCNQHVNGQKDPRRAVERAVLRSYEPEAAAQGGYYVANAALWSRKANGAFCIANFVPRILEEVTTDDGVQKRKSWCLEATTEDGVVLPEVDVPVDGLDERQWWLKAWGAAARVNVGGQVHLIPALQSLSTPALRTVHAHLGWKQIGGAWLYLHAQGAIGASGPVDGIKVGVTGRLAECVLPPVLDLKAAVQASLALLDLGTPGAVALAATFRAPLGEFCKINHSVFLTGPTGVLKSALAGVMQAHWGSAFRGDHLIDNWSSTANSLERVGFMAKDMLCIIDDFAPKGTTVDVQKLHQTGDRLLRGAADSAGRGRMMANTDLRPTYWPRGLVAATGEDLPRGESLRARLFTLHLAAGDVDTEALTRLQRAGSEGLLAQCMSGFVQWLASRIDGLPAELAARLEKLRPAARRACKEESHRRSPENLASMGLGLSVLLQFALDVGAIDGAEHSRLWNDGWTKLMRVDQRGGLAEENAVEQFIDLVGAVLASGRAHGATRDTRPPFNREAVCGWRRWRSYSEGWSPEGDCIGWIDGDRLYLEPEASYAAAEALARSQGRSLAINSATLGRRLEEAGVLAEVGAGDRIAKQLRTGKGRKWGYVLRAADVLRSNVPDGAAAASPEGKSREEVDTM